MRKFDISKTFIILTKAVIQGELKSWVRNIVISPYFIQAETHNVLLIEIPYKSQYLSDLENFPK